MTCWFHTRVAHPFPVAPVVSARCPGVVCWTVMVPLHPRMHVPLVFWAPARCGTHVTDDLFGCPHSAASVLMERQVQAYGGTAASFLFVSVPARNSDVFVWLGRCKLIMLYIARSEYEGFSFVYDFFGPTDAFVPGWKSSGLGHREILGESQSKNMKALRLFGIFWYQPLQVFLVSACFGIQGAQDSSAVAAWCVFCYIPVQFVCEAFAARCTPGALTCFFALVEFGLVLTVGVSVAVTVGIVAARQLASCIMGGLSATAKASVAASDSGFPLFSVEAVCHSG